MFIYPTKVERITSNFRTKERPNHHGIDFAQAGTHEIVAVADGVVTRSYVSPSYGEVVFISHNTNGQAWKSVYAHLRPKSRTVRVDAKVKQGQVIGIMGNTGDSSGQHLHFELHKGQWNINKTNAVNPLDYLGKSLTSEYKGKSIVDYLNNIGIDSSKENRKKLAKEYGVNGYDLSGEKNLELLENMRKEKPEVSKLPSFKEGQKVKIKSSAKKYSKSIASIPSKYKNKTVTIMQVGNDDVLIKELYSWVKKSDLQ